MSQYGAIKRELSKQKKLWLVAGLLAIFVTLLGLLHAKVNPVLQYDHELFVRYEYWRLLTAHFVHLNMNHAAMNLAAGLLILFMFAEFVAARLWVYLTVFLSISISFGLYFFDKNIHYYVGFSGVLYGLWIFGALVSVRQMPWVCGVICLVLSYTVYEQQAAGFDAGYLLGWINGQVIVNAHLYGFIGGIFGAAIYWLNYFTFRHRISVGMKR